jgi:hypothetical protein
MAASISEIRCDPHEWDVFCAVRSSNSGVEVLIAGRSHSGCAECAGVGKIE